jgi:hypothetical protein
MWLFTRPVVWPAKAGAMGLAAGYKTGRLVGYRRLVFFGIGIAVGLLVAPTPGRELRQRMRERLMGPMGELPAVGETYEPAVDLTDEALTSDNP